jgi:squalene-hopene/tetraprenyl-beta-curcumene cyclase
MALHKKLALAAGLLSLFLVACSHEATPAPNYGDQKDAAVYLGHPGSRPAGSWDEKAAAAYLDQRLAWWSEWVGATRDHQTFCISCHTAVPYALSRPALRKALGEEESLSPNERKLVDNVIRRVRLGKDAGTFYNDQEDGPNKSAESRGTESVLNALVLASYDAQNGELGADTRSAFDNMWALQQTSGENKGAWSWLNFGLSPWESKDAEYYGAALAAVAVGYAPDSYRANANVQDRLKLLREYLGREYDTQSLHNRVVLLWASTKLPGLLEPAQQTSIINEVLGRQRADGGWSLTPLVRTWGSWGLRSWAHMWLRNDKTLYEQTSDGYATGLVVLTLEQTGISRKNLQVQKGLSWLVRNQSTTDGLWPAYSLNQRRNPSSNIGRFMSDAATAYAVLALTYQTDAQRREAESMHQ